jgi:coenzyme PQQ precursor peptide PqqA
MEGTPMKKWKKPIVIEIPVGLEINAYACAEI